MELVPHVLFQDVLIVSKIKILKKHYVAVVLAHLYWEPKTQAVKLHVGLNTVRLIVLIVKQSLSVLLVPVRATWMGEFANHVS